MATVGYAGKRVDDSHADLRTSEAWSIEDAMGASPSDAKILTEKAVSDELANFSSASGWDLIAATKYTATPSSTSVLLMSDTSDVAAGKPIKYEINSTYYYGIVTDVSTDTSITIAGAPLSDDVDVLYVGGVERIVPFLCAIRGEFGQTTDTSLLWSQSKIAETWDTDEAYLVRIRFYSESVIGGSTPRLNIWMGLAGDYVSTMNSNDGPDVGSGAGYDDNDPVAINTVNYQITFDDELEVACTSAGGILEDVSVKLVFVLA